MSFAKQELWIESQSETRERGGGFKNNGHIWNRTLQGTRDLAFNKD